MGIVTGLGVKRSHGKPLDLVSEIDIAPEGIEGNVHQVAHRRITLLNQEQWDDATREAGSEAPWQRRRANILVENFPLSTSIGTRLKLGEAVLYIHGETHPCGQMDHVRQGLRNALESECRGGVHGSVETPGRVKTGDTISFADGSE